LRTRVRLRVFCKALPFGVVEAIWAVVAYRRWRLRMSAARMPPAH